MAVKSGNSAFVLRTMDHSASTDIKKKITLFIYLFKKITEDKLR